MVKHKRNLTHSLPRLSYEEIENMNTSLIKKESESVIKKLFHQNNPNFDRVLYLHSMKPFKN
jgi:hypothetical protein